MFKHAISKRGLFSTQQTIKIQQYGKGTKLAGEGFIDDVLNADTMSGEGFLDSLKKFGKSVGKKLNKINNSELFTVLKSVANLKQGSAYARPGYPNEKHQILTSYDGKKIIANYSGPGTKIHARLARNDPAVSYVDSVAKTHDISYSKNKNNPKGIRAADIRFIKDLSKSGLEHPREASIAKNIILGKSLLEEIGINLMPKAFSGKGLFSDDFQNEFKFKKNKTPPPPPKADVAREFRRRLYRKYGV